MKNFIKKSYFKTAIMKKLAIVAAILLVAFTACKKEESTHHTQIPEYLTADFSVVVGKTATVESFVDYNGYYNENVIYTTDHLGVVVYDSSKLATSYLWEWGDGNSSYDIITSTYTSHVEYGDRVETTNFNTHKYSAPGTYTITLTVANGEGETDVASKTITIL